MKLIGQICLGILLAVLVLGIVAGIGYGVANHTSRTERDANLRKLLDLTPSFRETVEAERAAKTEHENYVYWKATNGIAEGEFEYATNLLSDHLPILTNAAVEWLQKAAAQNYEPAIDALAKLQSAQ
jgi:flagellar basal body-associated protein FliL